MWLNVNIVQQAWTFGEGQGQWKGWDVILVGKDGKVDSFWGLLQGLNTYAV